MATQALHWQTLLHLKSTTHAGASTRENECGELVADVIAFFPASRTGARFRKYSKNDRALARFTMSLSAQKAMSQCLFTRQRAVWRTGNIEIYLISAQSLSRTSHRSLSLAQFTSRP